jgi:acetyltransferase-like isoleucine patch superfamily enzyme
MFKFTFMRHLIVRFKEEYALSCRAYAFPGAERVHRTAIVLKDPWCEIVVGENSWVWHGTVMYARNEKPHPVESNDHIWIGRHCYIGQYNNLRTGGGSIEIGDSVAISQFVSLVAAGHGIDKDTCILQQPVPPKRGIRIGSDAWIGVGAIILPGVTVGDGSVIGAGAVVTHDTAPGSIVIGNPARLLRYR